MGWFYPDPPAPSQPSREPPGAATPMGNAPPPPINAGAEAIWLWPPESWPAQRAAMIAGFLPVVAPPASYAAPNRGIPPWPAEIWPSQRGAVIAGVLPPLQPKRPSKSSGASPANFFGIFSEASEKQFLMFHHLRHVTYDRAASRAGISLAGLDLKGSVNHDWLLRHSFRHKTYRKLTGGGTGTADLESLDWHDGRALRNWMQYHAQLHSQLDQYFGLRS